MESLSYIPGADIARRFALQNASKPATGKIEPICYDDSNPDHVESFELSADVLRTLAEIHMEIQPEHPQFATLVIPAVCMISSYACHRRRQSPRLWRPQEGAAPRHTFALRRSVRLRSSLSCRDHRRRTIRHPMISASR
jgi:hypothetical protein